MTEPGDGIEQANERGAAVLKTGPTALSAFYDVSRGQVVVELSTGLEVAFFPQNAQGLEDARPDDLEEIQINSSGLGLHFPKLDADLYIPAVANGIFGSKAWTAARKGVQ